MCVFRLNTFPCIYNLGLLRQWAYDVKNGRSSWQSCSRWSRTNKTSWVSVVAIFDFFYLS